MKSANVSKMTENLPFQTNATKKSGKEEEAVDFMAVLGSLAVNSQSAQYKNQNHQNVMSVESKATSAAEYNKYPVKEDRIPQAAKGLDQEQLEKAQEALDQFSDEVERQLEETFGVSKEELQAAMKELRLNVSDLMDPTNLANLVMKLTGQEDNLGLLMNADFQEFMKNMEMLSENFLQNLGMTEQEAKNLMNQLQQMGQIPEETVEVTQDQMEENSAVLQTEDDAMLQQKTEVSPEVDETADSAEEGVSKIISEETSKGNVSDEGNQNSQSSTEDTEGERGLFRRTEGSRQNVMEENTVHTVQTANTTETPVVNAAGVAQNTTFNVVDIIRQVSEFTRIMYQGDVTSMEMQLNPENLGKIYVQVTAKEGVITAHFAAQNEAVKEALESQITLLKENMNQQGIKVEAVEVTIASHEFERNLEENQHNQSQDEQREQNSKNHRNKRGISLNQLDELSGLMSEEEILAAKIMRDNGNSVDFTA
ncbi:MAG: hypothetical protein HFI37_03980 [Lachnospiraceae bacterium]|nr:hypothetical protein [Lachnospiraceae bacterium]